MVRIQVLRSVEQLQTGNIWITKYVTVHYGQWQLLSNLIGRILQPHIIQTSSKVGQKSHDVYENLCMAHGRNCAYSSKSFNL